MVLEEDKKNNSLEGRAKYPQPHNIHPPEIIDSNIALKEKYKEYLHAKAKHEKEYRKSKQNQRMYSALD